MLNKMVKKEAIGIISVFLFILLITTNAVASKIVTKSGPTKVQIYKISGDFSQVAYDGNNSEMYKTLTARDWEVQCDSFQKSLGEIRKEIRTMAPAKYLAAKKHNLPPTSNNIEGAVKSFSQSITKSNSNIRSSIDTANDEEIYTKSLTEKVNSKFTADDNMIEQHFGYAIGKKTINGKNVYVIAFRGTADTYSWIFTDFIAFPIEFLKTNTQVHIGFEWNRQACMKQNFLKDFIRAIQADASDPIIIITGHSMGAAIAVLETAYFIEEKIAEASNIQLVTLAEPCPGEKNFANRYKKQIKNYTWFCNLFDPVPVAPMIVGYKHFDYLFGLKMFSCGPKVPPIKNTFERHSIKYYIEYLNNL